MLQIANSHKIAQTNLYLIWIHTRVVALIYGA